MKFNGLRKTWQDGGVVINGWLSLPSGLSAEIMAHQGFDTLTIDLQHGLVDSQASISLLQAISTTNVTPLVRLADNDPAQAMKALDAGSAGVICPMIDCAKDVEDLMQACKYPPQGSRSWSPARASLRYGSDYYQHANQELLIMPMIETVKALENLDEILAVKGVEAIYVGPGDLTLALGLPPSTPMDHPTLIKARQKIMDACKKRKIVAGIHTSPEDAPAYVKEGFQFITVASDVFLLQKARNILMRTRETIGSTGGGVKGR